MVGTSFSVKRALFILSPVGVGILYYLQDLVGLYEGIVALREGTYDIRLVLQRLAWEQFVENQYLGVDYGNLSSLTMAGHWLHNAYLVLLFGAGILGAAPIFGYMALSVIRGVKTYFTGRTMKQRVIAGGLLAGCVVSLIEWLAYGQMFNHASWLGLCLLYMSPAYYSHR